MLKLVYNNRTILNSTRTGYVGFTPAEPPAPVPDYTLLQTDLRTLGLTNAYQTLGSSIDLSNMTHRFLCIKFGATNNQSGAGVYDVRLSPSNISSLRWHSYYSRIQRRAPLCYGRSTVTVNHNCYFTQSGSELYFATNTTAFRSGVWADYKVILNLDTGYIRVWVPSVDSYVEYSITAPTQFNCVSCNGDGGGYSSAIRNLYVYSAKTWDIALSL
jgi:hypothetical protein